jgi:hypothetical protein
MFADQRIQSDGRLDACRIEDVEANNKYGMLNADANGTRNSFAI